jgi:hypothetical protein
MIEECHNSDATQVCSGTQRELLITQVNESERDFSKYFKVSANRISTRDHICNLMTVRSPQNAAGLVPKGVTSDECRGVEMYKVLPGGLVAVNKTQRLIQQNVYSGLSPYATSFRQKVTLSLVRSAVVISRSD